MKLKNTFLINILLVLFCVVLIGCSSQTETTTSSNETVETVEKIQEENIDKGSVDIKITSVGDILLHGPIIDAYKNDSYNFNNIFKYVKPYIESSNYSVANMEGLTSDKDKYSGYPCFNAPTTILDSLKESGVDMLLGANNHRIDGGNAKYFDSLNEIEKRKFDFVGAKKTKEDKSYLVKDINGIKVGFINYTFNTTKELGQPSLNGIPFSKEVDGLVDNFNQDNLDETKKVLKTSIDNVKKDGAEFIIFYPHWGAEYHIEPMDYQRNISQFLCDEGVNLTIGGHPHVLEPIDTITSSSGDNKMVVLYSMGNFISNQRLETLNSYEGECGVIFNVTLNKDLNTNKVILKNYDYIPTWVRKYTNANSQTKFEIIPTIDIDKISDLQNSEKERIKKADNLVRTRLELYKK